MHKEGLAFDRYHATMGNFSLTDHSATTEGLPLAARPSRFYAAARKLPFMPCVGHERLAEGLIRKRLDVPRLRFLRQDKAGLALIADRLARGVMNFEIRAVRPGTIVFPQEPIADIWGPFLETQMMEVLFEHAFDEPMTVAGNAFAMRLEAGERWLSDFSLRRDGSLERACEIAKYSYIGGFNDTSNMEAAFQLELNAVGTMAHYLVQAFAGALASDEAVYPKKTDDKIAGKHFQEGAFERWLDAHPNGTTLLLDTVSLRLGVIHAIRAAKSSEKRRSALKAVRIDSGDLVLGAQWTRRMLDSNDLADVKIILTSDLDAEAIREIVSVCPFVYGFGVGTKLAAEVKHVAGVIFKLCMLGHTPTAKCSETPGKETFPGKLQILRHIDGDGFYVRDEICLEDESSRLPFPACSKLGCARLLKPFWDGGLRMEISSFAEQREFVLHQLRRFRNIREYRVEVSPALRALQKEVTDAMKVDKRGDEEITIVDEP